MPRAYVGGASGHRSRVTDVALEVRPTLILLSDAATRAVIQEYLRTAGASSASWDASHMRSPGVSIAVVDLPSDSSCQTNRRARGMASDSCRLPSPRRSQPSP